MVFSHSVGDLAIRVNEPLKPWTTFKIGGPARYFAQAATADEFRQALAFAREQSLALFILGGGSNILVSDRGFDGLVIHPIGKGAEFEGPGDTRLRAMGGETWDDIVRIATERELWGIENLSHIPGQVGAALVQNIGAYGQQISDVLESAEVLEIQSGKVRTLSPAECGFGYRRSIFNTASRSRFVILSLTILLTKDGGPNLNYPDISAWFGERDIKQPSITEIRDAIIQIRDRKFPFPREEKGGNAGSFFKNLVLNEDQFQNVRSAVSRNFQPADFERLDQIRSRSRAGQPIKIPTAFLMDICGLKGYEWGNARVNETQPLVILNKGRAIAIDVLSLAGHVRRTIYARTRMTIELEPELVGFDPQEVEGLLAIHS